MNRASREKILKRALKLAKKRQNVDYAAKIMDLSSKERAKLYERFRN